MVKHTFHLGEPLIILENVIKIAFKFFQAIW